MVGDDEYAQTNLREKYKTVDRTWTVHTPSVQPYDISDNEDTDDTPEETICIGLCIPI